jgi:hypothetical protein
MPDEPNLDLIRMVQQARMAHDAETIPSQVSGVYWIESKPRDSQQAPTSRAGEWLIPTDLQHVDELWSHIKTATENGTLGYKSKVSTVSRTNSVAAREIRVCTYDSTDTADVQRVRDALRTLGISDDIVYRAE